MRLLNHPLSAVFRPRRVALVGASDRPGSAGALFWENLSGFTGEVLPVNGSGRAVAGVRAYRSLTEIPGSIDLAVLVVPASAVAAVVRDAGAKGIPACVVITSGFAEAGPEGERLQAEVMAIARAGGVRIVGPNCFGVQNAEVGFNASLSPRLTASAGSLSLVTQSGAYGMALHSLAQDENLRFNKVYATGNKADLTDTELLDYLDSEGGSGPICFFLESLPDGRAFFEAARRVTRNRPVIVCRTGRSTAGSRAACSHTASLAGQQRVWSAAFAQAGVIVTKSGLEMLDAARALDGGHHPAGLRVGIVTNSGGTGVELTDLLADEGLDVPLLSAPLQTKLAETLPDLASPSNPVDLTTAWQRFTELYPFAIEQLVRSGEIDAVIAVLLQRSADEGVATAVAEKVQQLRAEGVTVPVYVCWVAAHDDRANAAPLRCAGVPVFEWPERTARAVGHAARYGAWLRPEGSWLTLDRRVSVEPGLGEQATGWLPVGESAFLLAEHGLPLVPWSLCGSVADAVQVAESFGYPVVLKAIHADLLHKSDADGVRLGLTGPDEVAAAGEFLLKFREGTELLVQQQHSGVEVIVGGVRDAEFGPVVLVGMGGVDVEVQDDVVLALAPLLLPEAEAMVRRLRGAAALLGARRPAIDLTSLADVVCRLGRLMVEHPDIEEVDLNPVLARPDGCTVVDWRVRVRSSS
ncbi:MULTISPECIES: acetate--CoA ligase family protein [unclassified Nocardioides]|uniref:acetate--CoA ligase family protein n=1 Tax=unclassified Nocardioides TaxID=2615069 RepID=UPI000056F49F|nr:MULTISPECIES: acetate--CoA ligase family protein [unclassified Nocardioides]ABL79428.1 CoA-binding domain protein [Nocardioides sp. JS614]